MGRPLDFRDHLFFTYDTVAPYGHGEQFVSGVASDLFLETVGRRQQRHQIEMIFIAVTMGNALSVSFRKGLVANARCGESADVNFVRLEQRGALHSRKVSEGTPFAMACDAYRLAGMPLNEGPEGGLHLGPEAGLLCVPLHAQQEAPVDASGDGRPVG